MTHEVHEDEVHEGEVVRRATGFGSDGFVAEVTVKVADGFVTTRGESLTAEFAVAKARLAARAKLTARKRATGFTAEGFREQMNRAEYVGFAAVA